MAKLEEPIYHLPKVVKSSGQDDGQDFVGPLDLILHLLAKNKMEIQDIAIGTLVEQYLNWMAARRELDLEVASEFVSMAAQLVFIKSRMLLSIHDEEALSEMEQLMATLAQHKNRETFSQIKAIAPLLELRFQVGRDRIPKGPEPLTHPHTYQYVHARGDLRKAMSGIFERLGSQLPMTNRILEEIVGREPYPVLDKVKYLLARLAQSGVTNLEALFLDNASRSEVVATFLAVLELCKARRIFLTAGEAGYEVVCTTLGEEELWEDAV